VSKSFRAERLQPRLAGFCRGLGHSLHEAPRGSGSPPSTPP
jgi:hypothetical protein